MLFRTFRLVRLTLALCAMLACASALATPMVTYTWTTTSQGYGPHVGQPSTASFEVALSAVQSGKISYLDVTNIQLAYPGLSFDNTAVSTLGSDFGAYVDPLTGALQYVDNQQGLGILAYAGPSVNEMTTFLSITFDFPPGTSVQDQFNALNNGAPYAGYPTAGYWTATLPAIDPGPGTVPEPASLALIGMGLLGLAAARRRG